MASGRLKQYLIGFGVSLLYTAAGMAYGWAAPVMVRLQSNETSIAPMTVEQASWVVASIEIGDLFTPIPSGILADKIGRRPVLLSVLPMYITSWSLHVFTKSMSWLVVARILNGMCMGTVHAIGPLYLSEVLDSDIRGKLTAFCVVMWNVGILLSYSIGPYVTYDVLAYACLALPLVLSVFFVYTPESPYNLILRNRNKRAKKTLRLIRDGDDESVEEEMTRIKRAIDQEIAERMTYGSLFTNPVCRTSLSLFMIITVSLLLGGYTVVLSYATEIFTSNKGVSITPDQCTIILGIIYLILSILTMSGVDYFGRKALLVASTLGCGISQLLVALYFFVQKETNINVDDYSWVLVVSLGSYCISASVGIMPVTPVYQGEIFPNGIKGVASGMFTMTMCILSMTALKMFPIINAKLSIYVSFAFFASVNLVCCLLMYLFLIETNGKTLVEIQDELKAITSKSKHTRNQVREAIPLKYDS